MHWWIDVMPEYLREVEATLLDQRVDDAVHDGHQSQNQNGVKGLWMKRETVSPPQGKKKRNHCDWGKQTDLHLIRLDYKCTLQRPTNEWKTFLHSKPGWASSHQTYKVCVHGGGLQSPPRTLEDIWSYSIFKGNFHNSHLKMDTN